MEMIENKKLKLILNEIFSLENKVGHLKWKVSELARTCKVSKSLVYYHLGRSKSDILNSCIDIVAVEFYGLNPTRESMVKSGKLLDSLKYTRQMFLRTPSFALFYLRWRLSSSPIGVKLTDIDIRYQKKLKHIFPHLSSSDAQALHALFHGLVTFPVLDEEAMVTVLKWLPLKK